MKTIVFFAIVCAFVAACELNSELSVTEDIVENAISNLAKDHHHTQHYGPAWDAGVASRRVFYRDVFGEDWYNVLYASIAAAPDFNPDTQTYSGFWMKKENGGGNRETYEKYKLILSGTRNYLKHPERLKNFYLTHKNTIVRAINNSGEEFKQWACSELDYVIPFFRGDVLEAKRRILEERLHLSKAFTRGEISYEKLYAFDESRRDEIPDRDVNTYEWMERRRAEGGDDLVGMWTFVLTDLRDALQE